MTNSLPYHHQSSVLVIANNVDLLPSQQPCVKTTQSRHCVNHVRRASATNNGQKSVRRAYAWAQRKSDAVPRVWKPCALGPRTIMTYILHNLQIAYIRTKAGQMRKQNKSSVDFDRLRNFLASRDARISRTGFGKNGSTYTYRTTDCQIAALWWTCSSSIVNYSNGPWIMKDILYYPEFEPCKILFHSQSDFARYWSVISNFRILFYLFIVLRLVDFSMFPDVVNSFVNC